MSALAPLYRHLLSVCCNGCIPNLKLTAALQNLHAAACIYHHKEDVVVWAPAAGLKMRMIASKFRDMAYDDDILDRCLRKAWVLHKKIDWAILEPLGASIGSLGFGAYKIRIFRIWDL